MRYSGRVFRPPSEARSLIVQVTYGCSHNTCCFCDMYKEKRFTIRPLQEVLEDFAMARQYYSHVRRVFLADGDALMRKQEDLEIILDYVRETFPECERVTSYASPGSIHAKTPEQLVTLREKGLEVPRDVSVMGVDGLPLGDFLVPRLSTICQPTQQIARRSLEILRGCIEHQAPAHHEILPFEAKESESIRIFQSKDENEEINHA
jgi:hypothetical protein